MANYRFKTAEIEAMKKNILTHIEREAETKTAWRLRCAIEGLLMCCRPSKREAARLERELALYEKLTKNDLPNWQHEPTQPATPAEAPQISTETAETVNVSAEGEKAAERAENAPKRKIQYFHYTPEQLKRYIIDVYEKNANGEWVLQPYEQIDTDAGLWDVVDGKIGWWTNWRREKFSEMNMDFNSPTCGRCCKINRTYQTGNYVISNEKLLEFTMANGAYRCIQKQVYSKDGERKEFFTIMDAHGDFAVNDASDTLEGIMQRFDKYYKERATIIWQSPEFAPQSPETPQTVEYTTDTPKPRETARKPQNRGIGNTRHSRLGANGYAMLDNASATLTAMSVPRECSTADVAYW